MSIVQLFSSGYGERRTRVFGRLENGDHGADLDFGALRNEASQPQRIRKLGSHRAWAVVCEGLADLAWCEEPDGSFAIIDGELFGAVSPQGDTGAASAAAILSAF